MERKFPRNEIHRALPRSWLHSYSVHELHPAWVLNHIFDSTPSFASMHLPELGKTVSAAITTPAGTFAYSPDANIERLDVRRHSLRNAHLDIAMYAFTDHILADAVADAPNVGSRFAFTGTHSNMNREWARSIRRTPSFAARGRTSPSA